MLHLTRSFSCSFDILFCYPQKHVDHGQFPEFMPTDTIMQRKDWCVQQTP